MITKSVQLSKMKLDIEKRFNAGEITEKQAEIEVKKLIEFMNNRQPGELPGWC